jgi:membrane-anchored protein YejM (alkaline phosphatase superfamily)
LIKYLLIVCLSTSVSLSYIMKGKRNVGIFNLSIIGYSIMLYLLLFHAKTHQKFIGGYFSLLIGLLEGVYLECEFSEESLTHNIFNITTPIVSLFTLSYCEINWKKKSLFFLASRAIIIIIYEFRMCKLYHFEFLILLYI